MHDGLELGVEGGVGHVDADDPVGHAGVEELGGQALHASSGGTVGQAHDEGPVAQDLEVAALDGRGGRDPPHLAPQAGLRVIAAGELGQPRAEGRVVAVDGLVADGLTTARLQGHGVDRDPAVEPGRRVAGEEQVGQGGDDERPLQGGQVGGGEQVAPLGGAEALAQLGAGDAAQEHLGEVGVGQGLEVVDEQLGGGDADDVGADGLVQDQPAGLGDGQDLGEQLAEVVDDDALGAQDRGEGVVLGLGPGDVEGVVEEQGVGVDGGQAGDLTAGTVDDHLAQGAGLGVDSPSALGHGNEGTAGGRTGLCHGPRVVGGQGRLRPVTRNGPRHRRRPPSAGFVEQRIN